MTPSVALPQTTRPPRRLGLWLTSIVLLAVTAILLWRGYDFYRQDLAGQTVHRDYRALNPSGVIGQGYGVIGTVLILTNLLYLVRRRLTRLIPPRPGEMKAWLNMHALTGLLGSLLIVFHSAFQLRTLIATVTSVSLAIVVGTGLVGLYIYALVPKAGLTPFKDRLAELEPLLPGLTERVRRTVDDVPCTRLLADASFLRTIFTVPRWVWEAGARRRAVKRAAQRDKLLRVVAKNAPSLGRDLVLELADLAASEIDTNAGAALIRSWRSLHRFLALLMILTVTVHIGVAWYYGFRWIFSR